ncbi:MULTISPECIES: PTS sugar transporter subunit IIA [unclassified Enterococcus]|uniref:PTS sugar transporter subunit IIA n=1 Tax=unclassified Enterococcus TaxID=2608891 RepID=UPI0013EAABCA|nr:MULTISPECIES: PTS sugar transporter subunit IIA [unclassified Enterococcus]
MTALDITSIIRKDLLIAGSRSQTKRQILKEMTDLLEKQGMISDTAVFLTAIYQREKEGLTGIGQGIAIPHGKSSAVNQTVVAAATLKQPIPWETLDDENVSVVILFAVKAEEANVEHIQVLQKVARLLAKDHFIKELKETSTIEELYDLFTKNK